MRAVKLIIMAGAFLLGAAAEGLGAVKDIACDIPPDVLAARAGSSPKPLWSANLGSVLLDELQKVSDSEIIVGLKEDAPGLPNREYMLLRTSDGSCRWKYPRDPKAKYNLIRILDSLLLVRVQRQKDIQVLAVNTSSGSTKWQLSRKAGTVHILPSAQPARLVIAAIGNKEARITACNISDGSEIWERSFALKDTGAVPTPILSGDRLYCFHKGLEVLDIADGKTIYARGDIVMRPNSPAPQLAGDTLWLVKGGDQLCSIRAETGEDIWTTKLPYASAYTNIYPGEHLVFARGTRFGERYVICALNLADGAQRWCIEVAEPSLSNFIETTDRVYFATSASVVAVRGESGEVAFSSKVSVGGKLFPVRLREINDLIVFMGELVIAGVDAATGKTVYRHGFSPLSTLLHIDGLDAALERDRKESESMMAKVPGRSVSFSDWHSSQATYYQNMSNSYRSQANAARSTGDNFAGYYDFRSRMASNQARSESNLAFCLSIIELGSALSRAAAMKEIQALQQTIDRQDFFRSTIIQAYLQAESGDYILRPNLDYQSTFDQFEVLSVIRLSTGARKDICVSPNYREYGLWNLVDWENRVIYHHGVGLDPAKHQFSKPRNAEPYNNKVRTLDALLIAIPIDLP